MIDHHYGPYLVFHKGRLIGIWRERWPVTAPSAEIVQYRGTQPNAERTDIELVAHEMHYIRDRHSRIVGLEVDDPDFLRWVGGYRALTLDMLENLKSHTDAC